MKLKRLFHLRNVAKKLVDYRGTIHTVASNCKPGTPSVQLRLPGEDIYVLEMSKEEARDLADQLKRRISYLETQKMQEQKERKEPAQRGRKQLCKWCEKPFVAKHTGETLCKDCGKAEARSEEKFERQQDVAFARFLGEN